MGRARKNKNKKESTPKTRHRWIDKKEAGAYMAHTCKNCNMLKVETNNFYFYFDNLGNEFNERFLEGDINCLFMENDYSTELKSCLPESQGKLF